MQQPKISDKVKIAIVGVVLLVILVMFNRGIYKNEQLVKKGAFVLLELAPKDPRSIMQGDYMGLRYRIQWKIRTAMYDDDQEEERVGYAILKLNPDGVGKFDRIEYDFKSIPKGDIALKFTRTRKKVSFGADSYFFQEGEAKKYEDARYGGVKIDGYGKLVLVGLYDQDRKRIE